MSSASTKSHGRQGVAPKRTNVILRVQAQGTNGVWTQIGKDLSTSELTALHSQIAKEVGALANNQLVSPDYSADCLGVVVVAEKLEVGQASYILVSSVVTISKAVEKSDVLVTHDVIAEPNIALAAHAVVGQLVAMEVKGMLGGRP